MVLFKKLQGANNHYRGWSKDSDSVEVCFGAASALIQNSLQEEGLLREPQYRTHSQATLVFVVGLPQPPVQSLHTRLLHAGNLV